jgi:dienelactone hydrolase
LSGLLAALPVRRPVSAWELQPWQPRFLAAGLEWADLERIGAALDDGLEWAQAWAGLGEWYADLADAAVLDHHELAAGEHFTRASLAYHFAGLEGVVDDSLARRLNRRRAGYATRALPFLDPPGERVLVPFDGVELRGLLRRPASAGPWPVMVLLPGISSSKEELAAFEAPLLARGLATLALDGPGLGETRWRMAWRADFEWVGGAVLDFLQRRDDVRPRRIGLLGVELGGYQAIRAAGLDNRFHCCVSLSAPFDLVGWGGLPPELRQHIAMSCGADSERGARSVAAEVSLDGLVQRVRCPLLIVHGARDEVFPLAEAERLAAGATSSANRRLVVVEDGDHRCENRALQCRLLVADWAREQLIH